MPTLRLLSFQTRGFPGEVEKNVNLLSSTIEKHRDDFDLIVTPELFITGYNIGIEESRAIGDNFEKSIAAVKEIAKKYSKGIIFGYIEKDLKDDQPLYYNSAMFVDELGNTLVNYRKTHLYDPHRVFERVLFSEGHEFAPIVTYKGIKIGILICWDIELSEPAKVLALQGAELIVVPTANCEPYVAKFTVASRACENHVFITYVNHINTMKDLTFCGNSLTMGPDGKALCQGTPDKEECLIALIDTDHNDYLEHKTRNPLMIDRRPHLYAPIAHFEK